MSVLVDLVELERRREVAAGPLSPLATSLRAELQRVVEGEWEIPREKALLSRVGGRCPNDGSFLAFDPFDARHRCPRCGVEVRGELHDRFRPYWYQLWLAERSVHAALLGVLLGDVSCIEAASAILDGYAARYLAYPNRDNVLGPSRPFFSTYLESIWLLQLIVALDLLESGVPSPAVRMLGGRVRDSIIAPSLALIASYDEGMSNRQVWNNAAIIAASSLLGNESSADRALHGPSGLSAHLEQALLADGSWYEGENYHLFAHRGLWYAVLMAERRGTPPPASLVARFDEGFVAPFRTLLPDLTYPSRRDSQYAVSIRQPRFAESCELGVARTGDPRLVGILARLYEPSVPRGDTGRASSTADVERNVAATALTRADLSWRSLLFAPSALELSGAVPLGSDLLPAQGFGILRRAGGEIYVGLDYGHSGGGHGHPDRLNLLLSDGATRWFDDPGTGSYVDDSLHWYRSTLAHTAPLIDGRSQPRVDGTLAAFEEADGAGWISARAELAPGCIVRRSVVVLDDYLVDRLEWESEDVHEIALPLHGVRAIEPNGEASTATPTSIGASDAPADGFVYLHETARLELGRDRILRLLGTRRSSGDSRALHGWIIVPEATRLRSAIAPGAPGAEAQPLVLVGSTGRGGAIVGVWSLRGAVSSVRMDGDSITVVRPDGAVHEHRATTRGWQVTVTRANGARVIELREVSEAAAPPGVVAARSVNAERDGASSHPLSLPARFELGAEHYRRSEESWEEAGRPSATVDVAQRSGALELTIDVPRSECRFVPIDAENPLDNDPAAIHGDGVQLYIDLGARSAGWLLVPIAGTDRVAMRRAEGWPDAIEMRATWRPSGTGYTIAARIALPSAAVDVGVDVLVNEIGAGRQRRRGQLVLSGARGEFVYLRSDRHERDRLIRLALEPHRQTSA